MTALRVSIAATAVSRWLPTSRRALSTGMLGSFMNVGGAIGAAATGALLTQVSWRWPFFTFAYMTGIAYLGALVTYQVGMMFV